jgi:hypothetical protein
MTSPAYQQGSTSQSDLYGHLVAANRATIKTQRGNLFGGSDGKALTAFLKSGGWPSLPTRRRKERLILRAANTQGPRERSRHHRGLALASQWTVRDQSDPERNNHLSGMIPSACDADGSLNRRKAEHAGGSPHSLNHSRLEKSRRKYADGGNPL